MERKPVMSIKIEPNGQSVHMKAENAEILMIPFKGSVESGIFTGIVEPCGVDTQIVNAAGVRHMSARYILTGKDAAGKDAHIYIDNNGWFSEASGPVPFRTVPTIHTDSDVLAPCLHRNQFMAEGGDREDGFYIEIYEIER